jgi:RimJ/RimL family protein N-acetyltransferase
MHRRIGPDGIELGYWIAASHTRRGLATAAAAALTDAALALPSIRRVEIHHDTNNRASAGIPARLGFEQVGEEPGASSPAGSGVESIWRTARPVLPPSPET